MGRAPGAQYLMLFLGLVWLAVPCAGWTDVGDCGLSVRRAADAQAYYLIIGSDGGVPPEVRVQVRGRTLRVSLTQDAQAPAVRCSSRLSRSYMLPLDANVRRMERRTDAGHLVLVFPRRGTPWR
jgi:hypothetical protein